MMDTELWARCRSAPLPDGPEGQDFVTWLAEEARIAKSRAAELVLDYRRCLYLAASGVATPPVLPREIGKVLALHQASGAFPAFCTEVLGQTALPAFAPPSRPGIAAMKAVYEAEFAKAPNPRIWSHKSRRWYWIAAAILLAAGAVGALVDGSLTLLALGGIPAALLVVFLLTEGRMAGSDGLSDAARYGGGMGGGGGGI